MAVEFNRSWRYNTYGSSITPYKVDNIIKSSGMPASIRMPYSPGATFRLQVMGYPGISKLTPWPNSDWSCTIFDGTIITPKRDDSPVWGYGCCRKIAVGIWPQDDVWMAGLRIWHELLHAINLDPHGIYWSNGKPGPDFYPFINWLKTDPRFKNDKVIQSYLYGDLQYMSPLQINMVAYAYYTYLWTKNGLPFS